MWRGRGESIRPDRNLGDGGRRLPSLPGARGFGPLQIEVPIRGEGHAWASNTGPVPDWSLRAAPGTASNNFRPSPREAGRGPRGRKSPLTHQYMPSRRFCKGSSWRIDRSLENRSPIENRRSRCLMGRPSHHRPPPPWGSPTGPAAYHQRPSHPCPCACRGLISCLEIPPPGNPPRALVHCGEELGPNLSLWPIPSLAMSTCPDVAAPQSPASFGASAADPRHARTSAAGPGLLGGAGRTQRGSALGGDAGVSRRFGRGQSP